MKNHHFFYTRDFKKQHEVKNIKKKYDLIETGSECFHLSCDTCLDSSSNYKGNVLFQIVYADLSFPKKNHMNYEYTQQPYQQMLEGKKN